MYFRRALTIHARVYRWGDFTSKWENMAAAEMELTKASEPGTEDELIMPHMVCVLQLQGKSNVKYKHSLWKNLRPGGRAEVLAA